MLRRISLIVAPVIIAAALCANGWGAQILSPTTRNIQPRLLSSSLIANKLGSIPIAQMGNLSALCEIGGQMYGAGSGRVALVGENGQITRTLPMNITQVAGISRYQAGSMIIGDSGSRAVYTMQLQTGQVSKLFGLNEISAAGFHTGPILLDGLLTSVASDGTNVFLAFSAGFSSSIFKIDPIRRTVLAHGWAHGDNCNAMTFQEGSLYVLDNKGQQLRRYDASLKQNYRWIEVPVTGARGLIIRGSEIRVLSQAETGVIRLQSQLGDLSVSSTIQMVQPILKANIKVLQLHKYAVLICGDVADSCYYCDAFWNDTLWMYKTLLAAGYTKDNIYVLYGSGTDFPSANPKYQYPETVTDFPATITWVNKVFDGLKNGDAANGITKMTDSDTLFIWTFDHGSGSNPAYLCLMDGDMRDVEFATKLNAVAYQKRAIFMQQCRSGGFIDNVKNSKTFTSTACRADQNAQAADTENESYGGKTYWHGEYNYHIICALSGLDPSGAPMNADSNSNGKVSAKEAHNWDVTHESRAEVPQSDDSGGVGDTFYTKN